MLNTGEDVFDWDAGNSGKNLQHGVQDWEIEEALLDPKSKVVGKSFVKGEWRFKYWDAR